MGSGSTARWGVGIRAGSNRLCLLDETDPGSAHPSGAEAAPFRGNFLQINHVVPRGRPPFEANLRQVLFDVFHCQECAVISAGRVHGASNHGGEGVADLGVLRQQGFHDIDVFLISHVGV